MGGIFAEGELLVAVLSDTPTLNVSSQADKSNRLFNTSTSSAKRRYTQDSFNNESYSSTASQTYKRPRRSSIWLTASTLASREASIDHSNETNNTLRSNGAVGSPKFIYAPRLSPPNSDSHDRSLKMVPRQNRRVLSASFLDTRPQRSRLHIEQLVDNSQEYDFTNNDNDDDGSEVANTSAVSLPPPKEKDYKVPDPHKLSPLPSTSESRTSNEVCQESPANLKTSNIRFPPPSKPITESTPRTGTSPLSNINNTNHPELRPTSPTRRSSSSRVNLLGKPPILSSTPLKSDLPVAENLAENLSIREEISKSSHSNSSVDSSVSSSEEEVVNKPVELKTKPKLVPYVYQNKKNEALKEIAKQKLALEKKKKQEQENKKDNTTQKSSDSDSDSSESSDSSDSSYYSESEEGSESENKSEIENENEEKSDGIIINEDKRSEAHSNENNTGSELKNSLSLTNEKAHIISNVATKPLASSDFNKGLKETPKNFVNNVQSSPQLNVETKLNGDMNIKNNFEDTIITSVVTISEKKTQLPIENISQPKKVAQLDGLDSTNPSTDPKLDSLSAENNTPNKTQIDSNLNSENGKISSSDQNIEIITLDTPEEKDSELGSLEPLKVVPEKSVALDVNDDDNINKITKPPQSEPLSINLDNDEDKVNDEINSGSSSSSSSSESSSSESEAEEEGHDDMTVVNSKIVLNNTTQISKANKNSDTASTPPKKPETPTPKSQQSGKTNQIKLPGISTTLSSLAARAPPEVHEYSVAQTALSGLRRKNILSSKSEPVTNHEDSSEDSELDSDDDDDDDSSGSGSDSSISGDEDSSSNKINTRSKLNKKSAAPVPKSKAISVAGTTMNGNKTVSNNAVFGNAAALAKKRRRQKVKKFNEIFG